MAGRRAMGKASLGRGRGVFITGGGTGGHVEPALAIAAALERRGIARDAITFVGSRRGMEATLVPAAGYAIELLPGRGLQRRLTPQNLAALAGLAWAFVLALGLVLRRRPAVVVMVGGYAGVGCSLAAAAARVPLVVVSVDAVPGRANRIAARFARLSATATATTALPRAVETGAPVRDAVRLAQRDGESREAARGALAVPKGRRLVVVVGGSLGAGRLNDAALELRARLAFRSDLVLLHVAGQRNLDSVAARVAARPIPDDGLAYRLVGFEADLPRVFAAADLVVTRAGAMTVAELCVIGVPSVLVPLPGAPGDHQRHNAKRLARQGAAVLVEDAEATGTRLEAVLTDLLGADDVLDAMASAARALGRPDAADSIALLVAEVAAPPPAAADAR